MRLFGLFETSSCAAIMEEAQEEEVNITPTRSCKKPTPTRSSKKHAGVSSLYKTKFNPEWMKEFSFVKPVRSNRYM